jgi:hypothetical protein
MPFTIQSPNMNLPVPTVSVEPGPQYASDVNNCLGLVDSHDHSFGKGVLITPNGLNINSDLSIGINNLTNIRAARFTPQNPPITATAPDVDEVYVSGVDLYFNDGNNNIVRITQNGGVAGSPGSISGLSSPASASYNAGTSEFIWQSGANLPASMDNGPVTIRNITVGSAGITVQIPSAFTSDYNLTLPISPPATTSIVTLDPSGNLATFPTSNPASNSYVTVSSTGILSTAAINTYVASSSSGIFTTSGFVVPVTNMQISITTHKGNPVMIGFMATPVASGGSTSYIGANAGSGNTAAAQFTLWNGVVNVGTALNSVEIYLNGAAGAPLSDLQPPGSLNSIDASVAGTPGTYTYSLSATALAGVANVNYVTMYAYEL